MAENGGNGGVKAPGRSPGEGGGSGQAEGPGRQERLARALRDNLRKRKAQQRGRRETLGAAQTGDAGAPAESAASDTAAEETVSSAGRSGRTVEEGEPQGR